MKRPASELYGAARQLLRLGEPPVQRVPELEVQARLFSGELGRVFTTTTGRPVEILSFGEWNKEAGPDFLGAVIRVDGAEPVRGEIELDMDRRDWEAHGHACNPAFAGVVLQLFVEASGAVAFARTIDNREVLQARVDLERDSLPAPAAVAGPVSMQDALAMIEAAAAFRLNAKRERHQRAVALHGAPAALFQAMAAGMGYKGNVIPFQLVAQRTGLASAIGPDGEARLFGIAGFLEPRTFDDGSAETRGYLRPLWESWWPLRGSLARLVLPASIWHFSSIRPANHPHRRMAALAEVARRFDELQSHTREGGVAGFGAFLGRLTHPYWSRHWNLSASVLEKETGLIGPDRITDLVINALIPSLPADEAWREWCGRLGPAPSTAVQRACEWLVGTRIPALYRSAMQQQGLLQLYRDFGSLTPLEAWARVRTGGQST